MAKRYADLANAGLALVVFVHSPKSSLVKYQIPDMRKDQLAFDIVADPEKRIFHAYGIENSWKGFLSWRFLRKTFRAIHTGLFTTFKVDGGITGLPADILLDGDGVIQYVHYGKNIADLHTIDEVLTIAKNIWQH